MWNNGTSFELVHEFMWHSINHRDFPLFFANTPRWALSSSRLHSHQHLSIHKLYAKHGKKFIKNILKYAKPNILTPIPTPHHNFSILEVKIPLHSFFNREIIRREMNSMQHFSLSGMHETVVKSLDNFPTGNFMEHFQFLSS